MLSAGAKLGRYEIRSRLGAGGMGEVYLARDTRLDRNVALKVLPDEVAANPDRMRRFEQEGKAASGLNHPNIITVHEIDRSGSTSFIVTEFIEGSTLRDRLRAGPMPIDEALNVAVQIAGALAAAHANGIVHRDIKPENVILRNDGIVKVLDFGLAKSNNQLDSVDAEALTRAQRTDYGVVMGTATYMSPEQARGQQVDARTDIFSLGIMLYELLTGHLPFEGSHVNEIIAAILNDRDAPPLARYSSEFPAELERIVGKALRKNRDERYQTIKDLLLDLQSLRQRLEFERAYPTSVSKVDTAVVVHPKPRRIPVGAAWVLLAVVAGAIGYAGWRQIHAVSTPEIRSLAVLPIKSLDAGENYLGMGIADATIRRVSQNGRVIVRPTSAVRRYLTEDIDALTAAKQLGVDSVLEGSFQRADDRLRVSVNLLRCRDGASLWADSFDIRMADIFTVQDTVAQQVASRLRLQLDPSQQAQLTKHYTSNPDAYEYYLKGTYTSDQRMRGRVRPMIESAIEFYKKAIELDPKFALAHAQLANSYAELAVFVDPRQTEWLAHAKEEIDRAQELDPQLAETHLVRYRLLYSEFEGYQAEAATREVLLAVKLNPNVGHTELAYMYSHLGLEDLTVRELDRAQQIDPTSFGLKNGKLLRYEAESNYEGYAADQSVRPDERMETVYLLTKGRVDEAQRVIDEWSVRDPDRVAVAPLKGLLLAVKRDFRAAEAEIPATLARHALKDPMYHHAAYDIACIYAMEGKSAEAVKWLRESAVTGFHLYPRYTREAFLDPIRKSPEFVQFLAEMKAENDRYRQEFSQ
jgi:serine/threonine-protein kinase